MNKLLAVVLFSAFAIQVFQGNLLILDYYTNTSSFSKFCENKSRPQLHCNGKCILMKKIAEKAKDNEQRTEQKKNAVQVLFSESYFAGIPGHHFINFEYNPQRETFIIPGFEREVLHPPSVKILC